MWILENVDFGLGKVKWVDMWGRHDLSEEETSPEPFSAMAGERGSKGDGATSLPLSRRARGKVRWEWIWSVIKMGRVLLWADTSYTNELVWLGLTDLECPRSFWAMNEWEATDRNTRSSRVKAQDLGTDQPTQSSRGNRLLFCLVSYPKCPSLLGPEVITDIIWFKSKDSKLQARVPAAAVEVSVAGIRQAEGAGTPCGQLTMLRVRRGDWRKTGICAISCSGFLNQYPQGIL